MTEIADNLRWRQELDGGPMLPNDARRLMREAATKIDQQWEALRAVEEWWLQEGMKHFNGAPYAIFAVREALAPTIQQSAGTSK